MPSKCSTAEILHTKKDFFAKNCVLWEAKQGVNLLIHPNCKQKQAQQDPPNNPAHSLCLLNLPCLQRVPQAHSAVSAATTWG